MANPTTAAASTLNVVTATTADASIALDSRSAYLVQHNGLNSSGSASTGVAYLSGSSTVEATAGDNPNKFILLSQTAILVGPGLARLGFKTASGEVTISLSATRRVST